MRKILIVDDTPIVLEGTALSVESFGFSVEKSSNGAAAIEIYKSGCCAAVLLDCNMPEMNGFECARQIRLLEIESGSHIPIIGFSSSSDSNIREQCLAAGMDDFITKDCSQTALSNILANWAGTPDKTNMRNQSLVHAPTGDLVLTLGQIDAISDYFEGNEHPNLEITVVHSGTEDGTIYFSVGTDFYKCQPITPTVWRVENCDSKRLPG